MVACKNIKKLHKLYNWKKLQDKLDETVINDLIKFMLNWVKAAILAKGRLTKYRDRLSSTFINL